MGSSSGVTGALEFYNATAGSARMLLTSAGSLGIGSTNPLAPLDVNGTVAATALVGHGTTVSATDTLILGTTGQNTFFLDRPNGSPYSATGFSIGYNGVRPGSGGPAPVLTVWNNQTDRSQMLAINSATGGGGTDQVLILPAPQVAAASVGIGTTGPASFFDVYATGNGRHALTVSQSNGSVGIGTSSAGGLLDVRTSNPAVGAFLIDGTGNVGIGTSAVNSLLDVNGAITMRPMTAPSGTSGLAMIYYDQADGHFKVNENGNGPVALVSSDTNLNMGAFAVSSASHILGLGDGSGTAAANPGLLRGANGVGTNIQGGMLIVQAGNGTGSAGSGAIQFKTAAAAGSGSTADTLNTAMTITPNGNIGIGTSFPGLPLEIATPANAQLRLGNGNASGTATYDIGRNNGDGVLHFVGNSSANAGYSFEGAGGDNATALTVRNNFSSSGRNPMVSVVNYMGTSGLSGFPMLQLYNGRGSSAGATPLQSGDTVGRLMMAGEGGGGTLIPGATIDAVSEGNFTTSSGQAGLRFSTNIGASSPTERMRITSSGSVGIGSPIPTQALDVNGAISTAAGQGFKVRYGSSSVTVSSLTTGGSTTQTSISLGYTFSMTPTITLTNTSSASSCLGLIASALNASTSTFTLSVF